MQSTVLSLSVYQPASFGYSQDVKLAGKFLARCKLTAPDLMPTRPHDLDRLLCTSGRLMLRSQVSKPE